ncbi:MAG: LemA family protein [Candidatus Liptonbacteria bacterium]|nr:LemA family protein [Candidatus Liptonbacteria bacterium]
MDLIIIILVLLVLLIVFVAFIYNRLVALRNRVKEAWSAIDIQLKERYNVIINLVEAVKGYAAHEKSVLEKVTASRVAAMGAKTTKEHAEAENMLSQTLKSLFAVAEAYPDLKASANFLQLQQRISETESKLYAANRFYNNTVKDINIAVESFPINMMASAFGFHKEEFFKLDEAEASKAKESVLVKF